MKKFLTLIAVALFVVISVSSAKDGTGFQKDNLYIGPTVAYTSYFGEGTIGFGAHAEYGLMDKVVIGSFDGSIGLGADINYASKSIPFGWGEWSYSLLSIRVLGAYHFTPKNAFDPYLRLGLGYDAVSAKVTYNTGYDYGYNYSAGYGSGIGFSGDAGFNYHFSNSMSVRLCVGWPFLLSAGLDFNLGNMGWSK